MKHPLLVALALALPALPASALVDGSATGATQELYAKLQGLNSADSAAFGNEYATFWGVYPDGTAWYYPGHGEINSDIKNICGVLPALAGWDLSEFALKADLWRECNLNSIIESDARGMIICLSFHENNPSTGGNAWDTTMDLSDLLPGGKDHAAFEADWAKAADTIRLMKRSDGTPIPILLRPFHELTGNWFWWGSQTDKAEFVALWRWLVTYLRDTQGLHNLIYVYNTSQNLSKESDFLDRWPGDDYADIVSCDVYMTDADADSVLVNPLSLVAQVGVEKGKPAALAEVGGSNNGMGGSTLSDWWTRKVLHPIENAGLFPRICYIAGWANWGIDQYHIPYPDCLQSADFATFLRDGHIALLDDLNPSALWTDGTVLGDLYTPFYPWVYSTSHGWEYMDGLFNPKDGQFWTYDTALGWFWTSAAFRPIVWSQNYGWLYYGRTTGTGTRWFYRYSSSAWVSLPMSGAK